MGQKQNFVELLSSFKYLIVSENSSYADAVQSGLKKLGFRHFTTLNCSLKAIDYIKTHPIDFIFCQYEIPLMNALEFMEEIFANDEIVKIPFVIMSSKVKKADLAYMQERGADCFIKVPVDQKALAAVIKRLQYAYTNVKSPVYILEKIRLAVMKFDYGNAHILCDILKKFPDTNVRGRAFLAKGRVFIKQNAIEEATKCFQQAFRFLHFKVHPHQELGTIYLQMGLTDQALWHFQEAIDISPKNPYRYLVVGEIYIQYKAYQKAQTLITGSKRFLDESDYLDLIQFDVFFYLDQTEMAIKLFEKMKVGARELSISYLNKVAICFKRLKLFPKALHLYRQTLVDDSDNPELNFNLALLLYQTGKQAEALTAIKKAIQVKDGFYKAQRYLAMIEGDHAAVELIKKKVDNST